MRIIPYDRNAVLAYARTWAYSRNPAYYDFSAIGGDCTNFASQCLFAGCGVMNYTPELGWYYRSLNDRAPAWTGVEYFYRFLTANADGNGVGNGEGPFAVEVGIDKVEIGDFVQLGRAEDDFYHTLVIMEMSDTEITVAAHTNDAFLRPLSSYEYTLSRFLHIDGARFPIPSESATFYALLEGRSLPEEM